ncbi:MAG: FprA family A-type flavoprotein [Clostridia bacterium]|nr:FprA family A-type flavoprotein [Clostridia bacterium]
MFISNDIRYIGVNDHDIDLFEGQYYMPRGMAYNSYVIIDEKIAVTDTVAENFYDEWLGNLKKELNGRNPDYIIVHHMEPDHSANLLKFSDDYPGCKIVASKQAFNMMKNFFGTDFADKQLVINDGDELSLGKHNLKFFSAPMVHWPEVMVSYDLADKVLFSADAFGKFGALDIEDPEGWACEARRYYFGIVGKFGVQVQALLKKLSDIEINTICPLHGPVLNEDLGYYLNLYNIWSSYGVETDGVVIAYTSVYGNTEKAVQILKEKLIEAGCPKVAVTDLARDDMAEAVEDAFRYGKIVLATTTYNGEIFPFMKQFIDTLTEHGFKNKTIGFIENGTWNPVAAKRMRSMLEECKNITFTENTVKIFSALKDENIEQINNLAKELVK